MSEDPTQPNINSWLEDELFQQYKHDRKTVDATWTTVLEGNGHTAAPAAKATAVAEPPRALAVRTAEGPAVAIAEDDQLIPLRGPALRIAENMAASLTIPVATSQRTMPVKVIDENRRLINQHRSAAGQSKLSYTHLVAWAIVRAIETVPAVNQAYSERGEESFRVSRGHVNLGIAVDVAGKDGSRSLKVPSIKRAEAMNFAEFVAAYDDLVARARGNKLTVADFEGVTISLTNPGTVGTVGSIPRLMPGQGAIIATGAIDYPPEYRGVPEDVRSSMGLSKTMTVTCTYDHRVIQGAESGMFLARVQALLEGEDGFFNEIFRDLTIPAQAWRWQPDQATAPMVSADPLKQAGVARLIHAWRERGHLVADIDPLGLPRPSHPDLEPSAHGLTIWDLDRTFHAESFGVLPLRTLLDRLRNTYAAKTGAQFMHIDSREERTWIQERMESEAEQFSLDAATQRRILKDVVLTDGFEGFLDNRFKGHKRFSIEGGETTIAMIEELLENAALAGVHEIVIGMAHRGRLAVLANVIGKGVAQMFSEFEGDIDSDLAEGTGDVKYHLGASNVRRMSGGQEITISVAANPSHLEAVNPVVEGIVRPKQNRLGDAKRERVIPVLIHGDAAMSGQGIVAETLNFSQVEGYTTGGTIHLVINNQIGFTTNPREARSTTYCTDVALGIQAPVFHVNGDDPEACVAAMELAFDYRQRFHKDVVLDMVCYRKHGHNEGDDPSYTQPLVYQKIESHKPVAALYAERLIHDGVVTAQEVAGWQEAQKKQLYEIYDHTQKVKEQFELLEMNPIAAEFLPGNLPPTAADRAVLDRIIDGITTFPADFHLHPKLTRFVERRKQAHDGPHVDWALAETLGFGSLVLEGTPVRLSGQDSGRGTFSQRHVEFHDAETDRVYSPLQHLAPQYATTQASFEVYNSPLSEFGVVGFEFGYSVADPLSLVLWEAQYGDFVNGAQVIIDQFISAAESKWGQPSGIVLLLPHGQEGGGPEHSSARLERFLQLCAENNMQVAYPTTPAQYFHLLRRQMRGGGDRRGLRKPLVVMTPKSLLRHPKVVSTVDELASGAFRTVLDDARVSDPARVTRILACTGKIYYELLAAHETRGGNFAGDVAIVRLEQLYPFPQSEFAEVLRRYPAAQHVVWVQEEPRNMGAWAFIRGHIQPMLAPNQAIGYAGRPRSASPAPGSPKVHQREQAQLIEAAFAAPTVARLSRRRLIRRRKER
ncbi:MAG: multifunctional oxoglutarate decarboxylase/oxoglutarate dehydrogenase thiamine pyrophosphate-binding subunit/dihydrolipoyllysine-residue succinyltransferase subunit [Acidobacteriia bacterium]|nr:multifunctional oxoglutarate decarboxylase/oxoglutarate dehydrogenase thiamine pyrophosphate-binding subunit/dihydrolipoyllysine-residue succinyltransferase subunit [Terriglobia bacterium]